MEIDFSGLNMEELNELCQKADNELKQALLNGAGWNEVWEKKSPGNRACPGTLPKKRSCYKCYSRRFPVKKTITIIVYLFFPHTLNIGNVLGIRGKSRFFQFVHFVNAFL